MPGFKEGEYIFVYYRGTTTRGTGMAARWCTPPLASSGGVPELHAPPSRLIKFSDMIITDNSCKPARAPSSARWRISTPWATLSWWWSGRWGEISGGGRGSSTGGESVSKEVGKDADGSAQVREGRGGHQREVEKDFAYEAKAFKDEVRAIEGSSSPSGRVHVPRTPGIETCQEQSRRQGEGQGGAGVGQGGEAGARRTPRRRSRRHSERRERQGGA